MKKTIRNIGLFFAAALLFTNIGCSNGTVTTPVKYSETKAPRGYQVFEYLGVNGLIFDKTGEVVVSPYSMGKRSFTFTDNSAYTSYYDESDISTSFQFMSGKTVEISPFIMGQYEVTRTLFKNVMGFDPSYFQGTNYSEEFSTDKGQLRGEINFNEYNFGKDTTMPVENLSLLMVVGFCNKLSMLKGYDPVYTCSINGSVLELHKFTEADYKDSKYSNGKFFANSLSEKIVITADFTKNGYRLPTNAEFEFAAKGGNINAPEWKYAFSGIQSTKKVKLSNSEYDALSAEEKRLYYVSGHQIAEDDNLAEVAWYSGNSKIDFAFVTPVLGYEHHEQTYPHMTGLKMPNSLNLYDMSGNVSEFTFSDKFYFVGGNYDSRACYAAIGGANAINNSYSEGSVTSRSIGIRLCRTIVKK